MGLVFIRQYVSTSGHKCACSGGHSDAGPCDRTVPRVTAGPGGCGGAGGSAGQKSGQPLSGR